MKDRWLTYDDITLIPRRVSGLGSRSEADTSVQFGPIKLDIPLIAAPMPDVSNGTMAMAMAHHGSFGFIHRFQDIPEQLKQYHLWVPRQEGGVTVGVTGDFMERTKKLWDAGARIFCIDTANGANLKTARAIAFLRDLGKGNAFIIAGNVASKEGFLAVQSWGADAIRVGIAGGSVCETRTETGVYSPMASVILECAEVKKQSLLIADGGIKKPADMVKALALGADVVMAGGIFAGCEESPGSIIKINGVLHKMLRGAASFAVQKENGGEPEYVEGAEVPVPYTGAVSKVIKRYRNGLRSAMSYMDALTIKEFQQNVDIVRV